MLFRSTTYEVRARRTLTIENALLLQRKKKFVRVAANQCRSSEDGNVIDEVVVVEIKSFAVIESTCKARLRMSTSTAELTPLRPECSKEAMPQAADSIVGRSLALFVYLSTTLHQLRHCILEHASPRASGL